MVADTDGLRQVLACADGHIAAVSNFDKHLSQDVAFDMVALLHNLFKEVDPQLDVIMVHAPIPNDNDVVPSTVEQAGESELIIWWGQAALLDVGQAPWPDILRLTAR